MYKIFSAVEILPTQPSSRAMKLSEAKASSWLFCFIVPFAGAVGFMIFSPVQVVAQTTNSTNSTVSADASTTSTATRLGTIYGAAAGDSDGTLKLAPRPDRSAFYSMQYKSTANFEQEYREAYEKAYLSSYEAALKTRKTLTKSTQASSTKTTYTVTSPTQTSSVQASGK
jgi:hypothetical protein